MSDALVSWWTAPMTWAAFTLRAGEEWRRMHASKEGLKLAIWTNDMESRPASRTPTPPIETDVA